MLILVCQFKWKYWQILNSDCYFFRSLIIFNPSEQLSTSVISVHVDSPDVGVVDADTGRPMAVQISAVWVELSQASTEVFQVENVYITSMIY